MTSLNNGASISAKVSAVSATARGAGATLQEMAGAQVRVHDSMVLDASKGTGYQFWLILARARKIKAKSALASIMGFVLRRFLEIGYFAFYFSSFRLISITMRFSRIF